MANKIGHEAQRPNLALKQLEPWVGDWATTGTHPLVPGKMFHGRATFEWIEGGAFLMMRTQIDEPEIPSGIAVFGSDNTRGALFMLYFNERGVSRKYEVAVEHNIQRWLRNAPELSQRMTLTMADDGDTIIGKGEMSKDGGAWEPDLQLTYARTSGR